MILKYCDTIKLTPNDFLSNWELKPSAVLNLFQTVASDHAKMLGMGFEEMLEKDLLWVVVKSRYDVVAPVPFASTVKVVTVPQPKGRIGYVRDYFVYDLNDKLLIKGSTLWCFASASTRKFVRPTVEYPGTHVNEVAYTTDFDRLSAVQSQNEPYVCSILNTHIDRNLHANNIHYADFILDSMEEIPSIKAFAIQFSCEAKLGDKLAIVKKCENKTITFSAKNNERDAFFAKIETN